MSGEIDKASMVRHPPHYSGQTVECIEAIRSMLGRDGYRAFLRGQIMKYVWRVESKSDPEMDARKALWYAERLVEEYSS